MVGCVYQGRSLLSTIARLFAGVVSEPTRQVAQEQRTVTEKFVRGQRDDVTSVSGRDGNGRNRFVVSGQVTVDIAGHTNNFVTKTGLASGCGRQQTSAAPCRVSINKNAGLGLWLGAGRGIHTV